MRNGRYGPYLQPRRGHRVACPTDLPLDELTIDRAVEMLTAPKGGEPLGNDPETGLPVYAKNGRFGPYVQLGDADTLPPDRSRRCRRCSRRCRSRPITLDEALQLLSLPRVVGADPDDGGEIVAANGRYGPYVKKGEETRSLDDRGAAVHDHARRGGHGAGPAEAVRRRKAAPGRRRCGSSGNDPVTEKPMVVKDGRFGPYVTDGETNASLRKGDTVEGITVERASELLQIRRDAAPTKAKRRHAKKAAAKKKAPAEEGGGEEEGAREEGRAAKKTVVPQDRREGR